MTETVWDGSASTAWGTADNWSNGIGNDYHCILPDMSSITNKPTLTGNISVGSIRAVANSEIVGGGHTISCSLEGTSSEGYEHYTASFDGTITGELNLIITYGADESKLDLNASSGSIHDLTINKSGGDNTVLDASTSITGTFWIKDGSAVMQGNSNTLSVTEGIKLGNGSDTGFFGHNDHDGNITTGYLQLVTSGSTFISTEGTLTLTQDSTDALIYETISGSTFNNNDGTVLITGDGKLKPRAGTGNFHHLTINASGNTIDQSIALTCEGNLTITAGTLDTDSSNNYALTVTGYCDVLGTLTLNDSTVSVAALRTQSGAVMTQGSSGALTLAAANNFGGTEGSSYAWRNEDGTSDINLGGTTTVSAAGYFEARTAPDYASVLNNLVWNTNYYWVGNLTIGGTLVVNASKHLQPYAGSKDIVVTGDVTLNGQLTAHPNGHSDLDNMTFGSLTINSGGAYAATTGTTTITDQSGGGYGWNNAGTFTHNNGKVTFTDNLNPYIIESTFYDMEINLAQNTSELRSDDIGGAGFTILNDLTITRGRFKFNTAGDSMTVHGLTKLETNGQFGLNSPSGTHTFNGLVTLNGGTWFLSSGTNNMAGIRNVGGTIS